MPTHDETLIEAADHQDTRSRNSDTPNRQRQRKGNRIRTSCKRCQRRKIKCDAALPSCSSCRKSDSVCSYEDANRAQNLRAPYISALENRVNWLESIVRERCPDVDLSGALYTGPSASNGNGIASHEDLTETLAPQTQVPAQGLQENGTATNTDPQLFSQADQQDTTSENTQSGRIGLAHEVGLVALSAGNDPKYIGPSSGYFFTQLLLTASAKAGGAARVPFAPQTPSSGNDDTLSRELFRSSSTDLPATRDLAMQLSDTFFKTVHMQYPFLHHPTHIRTINHVYDSTDPDLVDVFQVNMVLSISAIILSRRTKMPLPGEGWCANAMDCFSKMSVESSIKGAQCLLLLLLYTIHSPSTRLNAWFLNYQCIAMVLDLGLQRDVSAAASITPLEQELRTRIFWVVYSLDRSLGTMMGRPIGLRDEACDLRLPTDVDDFDLSETSMGRDMYRSRSTHTSHAIHLFKLAKINSEIKYVLHSISRDTPSYAYPAIRDISVWQTDIRHRLEEWASSIPQHDDGQDYIVKLCQTRYHSIKMLLLRPSPGIPHPKAEALKECYNSAVSATRIFNEMYRKDMLIYSWVTFHSIILSTITMFYCIWTVADIAHDTKLDVLMADLRAASNILSATSEHWSGAKRSRDLLDELASSTIRRIIEMRGRGQGSAGYQNTSLAGLAGTNVVNSSQETNAYNDSTRPRALSNASGPQTPRGGSRSSLQPTLMNLEPNVDPIASLFNGPIDFDTDFLTEGLDIDAMMREVFDGFIPSFTAH